MTVRQLLDSGKFSVIHEGDETEREITVPFCCDLLSVAMGRAPAGCAWVTVMGNMNTLAVATLADVACVIMGEGCFRRDCPEKGTAAGNYRSGHRAACI